MQSQSHVEALKQQVLGLEDQVSASEGARAELRRQLTKSRQAFQQMQEQLATCQQAWGTVRPMPPLSCDPWSIVQR